ncbi:MAG: hypothetical protein ACK55I_22275, partial [bacterium]
MVHQEVHRRGTRLACDLLDPRPGEGKQRAPRDVHNDHVASLPGLEQRPQVLDVQVLADLRAVAVLVLEEGALRDHHLRAPELLAQQELARFRVARVGDERDLDHPGDLHPLRAQFAQPVLRQPVELVAQLAPALDGHETERRGGVAHLD